MRNLEGEGDKPHVEKYPSQRDAEQPTLCQESCYIHEENRLTGNFKTKYLTLHEVEIQSMHITQTAGEYEAQPENTPAQIHHDRHFGKDP